MRQKRRKKKRKEVHQKEVLPPTVEELSEWRSLPPQRPSTQTQIDPAGGRREGKTEKEREKY